MRKLGRVLTVVLLSQGLFAQSPENPNKCVAIRDVAIGSSSLPETVREQITNHFRRSERCVVGPNVDYSRFPADIQSDIQTSFQAQGYYKASVGMPTLSMVSEQGDVRVVDVAVAVDAGLQYRTGEIRFTGGTVFPSEEMRNLFPIQTGDVFNATKIGEGIREVEKLYESRGYAFYPHVVSATTTDDSSRTVDVTLALIEGEPYTFGQLTLDGPEPHPGAGRALLDSWRGLEGRPYNRASLDQWLADNWRNLPPGVDVGGLTKQTIHQGSHTVSVRLCFGKCTLYSPRRH